MATGPTTNFGLARPTFLATGWGDSLNDNSAIIDTLFGLFYTLPNFKGIWLPTTSYVIGDKTIDETSGTLWTCAVNHTSGGSTFLADRVANPTYWDEFNLTVPSPYRGTGVVGVASANQTIPFPSTLTTNKYDLLIEWQVTLGTNSWWISNKTTTSFQMNLDGVLGYGANFSWRVFLY